MSNKLNRSKTLTNITTEEDCSSFKTECAKQTQKPLRSTKRHMSQIKEDDSDYKMVTEKLRQQVQTLNVKIQSIHSKQNVARNKTNELQLIQSLQVYKKVTNHLEYNIKNLINVQQKLSRELNKQIQINKKQKLHTLKLEKRNRKLQKIVQLTISQRKTKWFNEPVFIKNNKEKRNISKEYYQSGLDLDRKHRSLV